MTWRWSWKLCPLLVDASNFISSSFVEVIYYEAVIRSCWPFLIVTYCLAEIVATHTCQFLLRLLKLIEWFLIKLIEVFGIACARIVKSRLCVKFIGVVCIMVMYWISSLRLIIISRPLMNLPSLTFVDFRASYLWYTF